MKNLEKVQEDFVKEIEQVYNENYDYAKETENVVDFMASQLKLHFNNWNPYENIELSRYFMTEFDIPESMFTFKPNRFIEKFTFEIAYDMEYTCEGKDWKEKSEKIINYYKLWELRQKTNFLMLQK